MRLLHTWIERDSPLKTFTLRVVSDYEELKALTDLYHNGEPNTFESGLSSPRAAEKLFDEFLEILRQECGSVSWSGVQRKLELDVLCIDDDNCKDPGEIIRAMHDAFGGELWFKQRVDTMWSNQAGAVFKERLYYKDGVEILNPFAYSKVCNGWQISWYREGDEWYWTRNQKEKKDVN